MLDFTREFKDSINKRLSIYNILDNILKLDYKEVNTGNFIRINPSPISGKNNNSFSIGKYSSGIEFYTLFSSSSDYNEFKDLPEKGTAADILSCICKDYEEVHQLIRKGKFLKLEKVERVVKEYKIDREELRDLYQESLDKMDFKRFKYYKSIRHFEDATISHFKIGFKNAIKIDDEWFNYYSFPFFNEDGLQHIKYKLIEKNAPKDYKTNQLSNNSGGDYFFNEVDLNKEIIIICEGEHDAMRIWERFTKDKPNYGVIAVSGKPSIRKLKKLPKDKEYILAFDDDEAGEEYTQKFKILFPDAKIMTGIGKDPDEWFIQGEVKID